MGAARRARKSTVRAGAGNPVNPDGAYEGNYNGFGTLNDPMVGPMNSLFSSSV
jgi:hypothetical protein